MRIDSAAIAQLLPHRDPILLVESVVLETPGESGRATVRLPGATRLLNDWRGMDLLQELALEAAAQALGVVLGSAARPAEKAGPAEARHLLLGFNEVEFGPATPDPAQPLEVSIAKQEGSGSTCVAQFSVEQCAQHIARGGVMVWQG